MSPIIFLAQFLSSVYLWDLLFLNPVHLFQRSILSLPYLVNLCSCLDLSLQRINDPWALSAPSFILRSGFQGILSLLYVLGWFPLCLRLMNLLLEAFVDNPQAISEHLQIVTLLLDAPAQVLLSLVFYSYMFRSQPQDHWFASSMIALHCFLQTFPGQLCLGSFILFRICISIYSVVCIKQKVYTIIVDCFWQKIYRLDIHHNLWDSLNSLNLQTQSIHPLIFTNPSWDSLLIGC